MNTRDQNATEPAYPETWVVWRIDDNANTFVVQDGLTREAAERLAAEFESRGHKQMYWVERDLRSY
jgi:hypothetical protein